MLTGILSQWEHRPASRAVIDITVLIIKMCQDSILTYGSFFSYGFLSPLETIILSIENRKNVHRLERKFSR